MSNNAPNHLPFSRIWYPVRLVLVLRSRRGYPSHIYMGECRSVEVRLSLAPVERMYEEYNKSAGVIGREMARMWTSGNSELGTRQEQGGL